MASTERNPIGIKMLRFIWGVYRAMMFPIACMIAIAASVLWLIATDKDAEDYDE